MNSSKKIKAALVDDSHAFCEAMQFYFNIVDEINLVVFNNAADFLNDYEHHSPDILLLDLFMPGIDGMTLLQELKKKNANLYIIIISGHADKHTAYKVKKMGANEFLSKPFNIDCLVEKIFSIFKSG
ncbi:MAG: response regulator [Gammaproteobacteria bacterium]|nr:response regulator [Gammaproteobacteria bacterium]